MTEGSSARSGAPQAYRSAPDVVWLKDVRQTIVVERATGRSWALRGRDAAAWDLLLLGYSFEQAARLLAAMADVADDEARTSLLTTLQGWERMGILVGEKGQRRDQSGR